MTDGLSTSDGSWTIADVERETGLGKDTLRVWERRYGFPAPLRDKLGERMYPQEQLERLRLIRRALDVGYRPGKVVAQPFAALQSLLATPAPTAHKGRQLGAGAGAPLDDADTWVQWLAENRTDLVRQTLQQRILRHGLGKVVDELVAPLCELVGRAWLHGQISVFQEHLFSETLQSVLRDAVSSVDAGGRASQQGPRVLLATTPGEQHGLGLRMAECHFALESCERFVLGTSTPVADIVQAATQLGIDVLGLSFSAYAARGDVVEVLRQLRDLLPASVEIWVGGAGAMACRRLLPDTIRIMESASEVTVAIGAWRTGRVEPDQ